jgi:hypothetical protein
MVGTTTGGRYHGAKAAADTHYSPQPDIISAIGEICGAPIYLNTMSFNVLPDLRIRVPICFAAQS